jgi:hypothetical protein
VQVAHVDVSYCAGLNDVSALHKAESVNLTGSRPARGVSALGDVAVLTVSAVTPVFTVRAPRVVIRVRTHLLHYTLRLSAVMLSAELSVSGDVACSAKH